MGMDRPPNAGRVNVYVVIVALARSDGSRAHDAKWVIASSAEQAGERALASAALRWPNRTPLEVVRTDRPQPTGEPSWHVRDEPPAPPPPQPADTIETQPVRAPELRRPVEVPHAEHADSRETAPARPAPFTVAADTLTDRVRATYRSLRARAPRRD